MVRKNLSNVLCNWSKLIAKHSWKILPRDAEAQLFESQFDVAPTEREQTLEICSFCVSVITQTIFYTTCLQFALTSNLCVYYRHYSYYKITQ